MLPAQRRAYARSPESMEKNAVCKTCQSKTRYGLGGARLHPVDHYSLVRPLCAQMTQWQSAHPAAHGNMI